MMFISSSQMSHVVQFKGYFETSTCSIILMEYLRGGQLFQYITTDDYRLTESKCEYFAKQILHAVDFMHSRKVIHLDLKPENIVLTENPQRYGPLYQPHLKLIDFGIARYLGDKTRLNIGACGTLEFISPEVIKSIHASPASDMWSVGVIFFMLLSGGISPFWDGTDRGTERAIRNAKFAKEGFHHPNFKDISAHAISCVSGLLVVESSKC